MTRDKTPSDFLLWTVQAKGRGLSKRFAPAVPLMNSCGSMVIPSHTGSANLSDVSQPNVCGHILHAWKGTILVHFLTVTDEVPRVVVTTRIAEEGTRGGSRNVSELLCIAAQCQAASSLEREIGKPQNS